MRRAYVRIKYLFNVYLIKKKVKKHFGNVGIIFKSTNKIKNFTPI